MVAITTFLGQLYPGEAIVTRECKTAGRGNDRERVDHVHHYIAERRISVLTDNYRGIHVQVDSISAEQVAIAAAAIQHLFTAVKESGAFTRFWMDIDLTEVDMATLRTITPRSMLTEGENPAPAEGAVYLSGVKQLCFWQSLDARVEDVQKRYITIDGRGRLDDYIAPVHDVISNGPEKVPAPLSNFYDKANMPAEPLPLMFVMIPPEQRVGAEVEFYQQMGPQQIAALLAQIFEANGPN